MKNQELTYEYEVQDSEFNLFNIWNFSRKLRENDILIMKGDDYSVTLGKSSLYELLKKASLPERYETYKKLKSTLNMYKIESIYCHIDDTSSEIEEFKRKYLLVFNKE